MNIIGVELPDIDYYDADVMEACDTYFQAVMDEVGNKDNYEGMSGPDGVRYQCRSINKFFDSMFGEGTAEKLFHGKSNLKDHMEAFGQVSEYIQNMRGDFENIIDKYAPNRAKPQNREQRRFQEKQKNKQQSKNYNQNNAAHYRNQNRKGQ